MLQQQLQSTNGVAAVAERAKNDLEETRCVRLSSLVPWTAGFLCQFNASTGRTLLSRGCHQNAEGAPVLVLGIADGHGLC